MLSSNLNKIIFIFICLFFFESMQIKAQSAAICQGDSAVLRMNCSYSGTIQWQYSSDQVTWSAVIGATLDTIKVIPSGTTYYRAVITNGTCNFVFSDTALITVNLIPPAPFLSVADTCGSSRLTAGSYTGTLLWSTGQNVNPITVNSAGTYTVSQTVNGCISATGSVTATPLFVPLAPTTITGTTSVCEGNNALAYSVTNVGGVTYTWTYSGTGYTQASGGTTNSITANFSGAATSGTLTVTPSNACGNGTAQTLVITVSVTPTIANAGTDINPACDATTATLAGNTPSVGTGAWSVISGTATITTPSSPTSGVTGLAVPGTATLRWTISNSPCIGYYDDVVITTTSCVWTCGSPFTDTRDGKTYNTVLIGSQCWMKENLNIGTSVTGVSEQTNNATIEKYCYADNAANCTTYGGLYQWAEMVQYTNGATNTASPSPALPANLQGICPSGWHLPTDAEWCTMENTVEAGTDAGCNTTSWRGTNTGAKLKTTTGWTTNNGTNTSGFSALPGGINIGFAGLGDTGMWWSATELNAWNAWFHAMNSPEVRVLRNTNGKSAGYSVRCIKN